MSPRASPDAATGDPVNGIFNIAGPEKRGMDDFIRTQFAEASDARQVVSDAQARYYGAVLDDRSIVPVDGENTTIFPRSFTDWLSSRAGAV